MNWRRVFPFVLVALALTIFIPQWMRLNDLLGVLRQGRPGWLLLALAFQILWFFNQAALYQSLYRLLDLPARARKLLPIVLAANFVNFATPTASLGAVPLFLDDARQRGLDPGKVTLTNVLRLILNLVWFSIPLSFSLTVLALQNSLQTYHIIAATLLLATTASMVLGLALAGLYPAGFAHLLVKLANMPNWLGRHLLRRDLINSEKTDGFARQFAAASSALWSGRRRLVRPLIHCMLLDALELVVLFAVFRAFPDAGQPLDLTQLIAGYNIGVLFSVVAITPQGLGVVEGTLVAAFTTLGVATSRATIVMLVYRGFSFWLLLIVGVVALRWVRGIGKAATDPADAEDDTSHLPVTPG